MGSSEAPAVLRATAALIGRTREVVPGYAGGFCASATRDISQLLKHTRTQLVERRFESGVKGIAFPVADGEHVIAIDSACSRADSIFTIRHELGHILAGEVGEALFLSSEDTMSFSERRADLFAIADILPTRFLERMHGRRRPWAHVELEAKHCFRELTDGWSEQRLEDRARLRVRLFREHGI